MRTQHNTHLVPLLLVAVVALSATTAVGGIVTPELEGVIDASAPQTELSILIELADRLDVDSLSFPTRSARRHGVAAALRTRAATAEAPVRRYLEQRGSTQVVSLWAVGGLTATLRADAVRDLAALPSVSSVRLDRVFAAPEPSPKATGGGDWNLEMVGAPDLWEKGIRGQGIVVAVVDSGVDVAHEDLGPRWRGGTNGWFDPHGEHSSPYDADSHGTQVAGIIVGGDAAGTAIGVAPGAQWIGGKTFDDSGFASLGATHEIFQWLLDPDGDPATDDAPHVVNNSWGFRDRPGECVDEFGDDIQVLRAAGIAVVFSAGNAGPQTATSMSPANNPGAFAVGGSDDEDDVMNTSGRGPSACDGGVFPALVAPGDGVRTADLTLGGTFPDATTEVLGTSFAAPHVAGAMALLLSAHSQATIEQLETALLMGAEDLGPDGPDNHSGWGRLDIVKAEEALAEMVGTAIGNATVYENENAFLSAIGGQDTVSEGFENNAVWGDVRSPAVAVSVTSQGVTWTSNHPENNITTNGGPARSGDWGFYSNPHGDQTLTGLNDFITDGFVGAGSTNLNAIGGWFISTSGGQISVILDGDEGNPISLGSVGNLAHVFYGVVVDGTFSSFEFRETEGTVEDPKLIFVDDITIGVEGGSINHPPVGVILQPVSDLSVAVGEPVFFDGTAADPDGDAVTVLWNFGDGTTSTALTPGDRSYAAAGSYVVNFTATDALGLSDPTPDSRSVTVTSPPAMPTTGVVAGVANFPGAQGSDWHTDLFLHNAASGPISLELSFAPANGVPGVPENLIVEPDQTLPLDDVVQTVFGVTGSGAIQWTVVSGDPTGLLASANTYNRVDPTRRYGQQVPGVRWSEAPLSGTSIWVPALAGRYRTNLGFATDETCTRVAIRGYDKSGLQVAQRILDVQPLSWVQLNGIFRNVFPGLITDPDLVPLADSVHRFEVVGENGRVVTYTSIIDNQTSDGSYMLGQLPADSLQFSWLPGVAKISGANNSVWRSDVILMHVGGAADSTNFGFFGPGANPSGSIDTQSVALGADESAVEEDILGSLFGYQPPASGSLLTVSPLASGGLAWMRTYTVEPVTGGDSQTYGQAIGPRSQDSMITAAIEGRIYGFSHDADSRSNLILQNTRSVDGEYLPTTARVEVLNSAGQSLHTQEYALEPGEYRQLNRFLNDYGISQLEAGALVVTILDQAGPGETGGVDAMVSEVNGNILDGTNDGRLIRAQGPALR